MFGILRFILASLVALSHFGLVVAGFNPGQWAVVAFYTLSGFLMEKQVRKLCPDTNRPGPFYLDRLLRIFPLYLGVFILALPFFSGSPFDYVQNVVLIPLNYQHFTGVPIAVGPAWSLACEVQFYLLVPFLTFFPKPILRGITLASSALFSFSPFLPHSTFWAYTSLPGILFVFCFGILLSREDYRFLLGLWAAGVVLLGVFLLSKVRHWGLPVGIHINVLIGFTLFLPVIGWLAKFSPKNRLDRFLGLFSFPLFLCHEPVRAYAGSFLHVTGMSGLLLLSLAASGGLILLIELPFDSLRYRLRSK